MNRRHIPTPYAPPAAAKKPVASGLKVSELATILRAALAVQAQAMGAALRGEKTAEDLQRQSAIRAYQRAQDARVARMGPDERRAEDEAWRERLRNLSGGRSSRGSL